MLNIIPPPTPADGPLLIDPEIAVALFAAMPAALHDQLLAATTRDLGEWTERLIAAWATGDGEAQSKARHALRGLCGSVGASALQALCEGQLGRAEAAQALRNCCAATATALLAVASLSHSAR